MAGAPFEAIGFIINGSAYRVCKANLLQKKAASTAAAVMSSEALAVSATKPEPRFRASASQVPAAQVRIEEYPLPLMLIRRQSQSA